MDRDFHEFLCNDREDNWATSWQNQQCGCAPSEGSDQPGHLPSLIRVFTVRMKKAWVLSYPLRVQGRLIRLGECPGWSESSLGAQPHRWFCHEAAQLPMASVTSQKLWASTCTYHIYKRPAKAQASQSLRCSHIWSMEIEDIRHLARLDGCACAFEERVYGGWKVP